MKKISAEALKLVEQGAPHLIDAVGQAVKESKDRKAAAPVLASLDAFEDDPMLLYACLWLAWSRGVVVMIRPMKAGGEAALRSTAHGKGSSRVDE